MIAPGHTCPECSRRVPYPRKESSPDSKTVAYRVPVDELEEHEAVWGAAVEHLGLTDAKFVKFKVLTVALTLVLADPTLKGVAA